MSYVRDNSNGYQDLGFSSSLRNMMTNQLTTMSRLFPKGSAAAKAVSKTANRMSEQSADAQCRGSAVPAHLMASCVKKVHVQKKSIKTAVAELEREAQAADEKKAAAAQAKADAAHAAKVADHKKALTERAQHSAAIHGQTKKKNTLLIIGGVGAAGLLLFAIMRRKK